MHEALQAVIAEAFAPAINLHHLQAGGRPENRRSLAVLARLGGAGWAGLGSALPTRAWRATTATSTAPGATTGC